MFWDCNLVMRASVSQQQTSQHKFPHHKIKNSQVDLQYVQPQTIWKQQTQNYKRCNTQYQRSKEVKKKKSLKNKHFSPKIKFPNNLITQQSQSVLTTQNSNRNLASNFTPEFQSSPHSIPIQTSRPTSQIQYEYFNSATTTQTKNSQFLPERQYSAITNREYCFAQRNNFQVKNNYNFNIVPQSNFQLHSVNTPKVISTNAQTRMCSPTYENRVNRGQMLTKQFKPFKPSFRTIRFTNNQSPLISLESQNVRQLNQKIKSTKTPKNHEEKQNYQDKENIINKINPPTQFNIEDDKSTIPTMESFLQVPQIKKELKKSRKRIQDFFASREQMKSVRDSDSSSEQCSQIITTFSDIMKEHGKFHLDN